MGLRIETKILRILVFLLVCCFWQGLSAQDITFEAKVPSEVNVDEPFRLHYILTGTTEGENFEAPKVFKGLDVISGPYLSTSTSLINGNYEYSQSFTYLVAATKKGVLSIPAATIEVEGKLYKTKEISIEAKGENVAEANNQSEIDAFIRTEVSRSEVYKDEAVVLSSRLYTKAPLLMVKGVDYPVLDGFEIGSEPFYDHQGIPVFKKEMYNGSEYYAGDLRKVIIYPTRTGKLVIPEVDAAFTFNVAKQNKNRGFNSREILIEGVDKQLKSEPVDIKVSALPKKKPADFSGAIGTFKMGSEIKNSKVKVGDLLGLSLIIEGYGDLNVVSPLSLDLPEGIEVYDMSNNNADVIFSDYGLQSEKIFRYILIAKKAGTYKLPPAKFVYLDVESGSYKTLMSSGYTISVAEVPIKGSVIACR